MTETKTATSVQRGSQWVQTGPLVFNHTLTTTAQRISEVPELTIPSSGVWALTYNVRSSARTSTAVLIYTWLGRGGGPIEGSEAIRTRSGTDAEHFQDMVGQTVLVALKEGERVTLHGQYTGEGTAGILSNGHGRTSVVAHLVSPEH